MSNYYITQNGAGAKNGSDWNNAWQNTSGINWGVLSPGDTMWVAGGTYAGFAWSKSGTSGNPISFKRATVNNVECTSSPGWQTEFDSQVHISVGDGAGYTGIYIVPPTSDYVIVDGQVSDGIKITLPNPNFDYYNNTCYQIFGIRSVGNGNIFKYIEIEGPVVPAANIGISIGNNYAFGMKDVAYIGYCNLHGLNSALFIGDTTNMVVEQCHIYENYGNSANHDNICYVFGFADHGIWRNNYVHDWGAMGLYFASLSRIDDWQVYGNIFKNVSSAGGTAIGLDPSGGPTSRYGPNWFFYNNTFVNCYLGIRASTARFYPNNASEGGYAKNNIFFNAAADFSALTHDYNFANYSSLSEINSVVNGINPFIDYSGSNFHIISTVSSNLPRNKGTDVGSPYNVDRDGNTRGADGNWDIGAYEYSTGGELVNTIKFSTDTSYVNESSGSITISCVRSIGSSGSVSVNYSTTNGSAFSGINYTTTSGAVSWSNADTSNKTFVVPVTNTSMTGSKVFYLNFSNPVNCVFGTPSTQSVYIIGSGGGSEPPNVGPNDLMWNANSGSFFYPMEVISSASVLFIRSAIQTISPIDTIGSASYSFVIHTSSYCFVEANALAPTDGNNSVYIDIDNNSFTEPFMVWDLPITLENWAQVTSSWRGNGPYDHDEYNPKTWYVTSGSHTLYIGSRESDTRIRNITMSLLPITQSNYVPKTNSIRVGNGGRNVVITSQGTGNIVVIVM